MRVIYFTRTLDCKVLSGAYGLTPVPSCGPLHSNSASPGLGFPAPPLPIPALWKEAHRALNVPLAHGKDAGGGSYCVYYPDTQYQVSEVKRSQKSGSLGGKGGIGLLFAERQMLQGWEAPGKALCSLRLLHVTVKFKVRQPSKGWG